MGAGNVLLSDEGAGVHALRILMREPWPEAVAFLEAGTFTQDLISLLDGSQGLLVLDVARFGGRPGEVRAFGPDEVCAAALASKGSLHQLGLADSLLLARALGQDPWFRLLAVEPLDCFTAGEALTGPVRLAMPRLLEAARHLMREFLQIRD